MSPEFRERVLLPIIMPFGVLIGFIAVAFSLSRVLLAVPETVATFTALAVAGYILLIASLVSRRPRITSRALGTGVALGLVAVVASGVVAASAGMRELHAEEEAAAEGGEGAAGEGEAVPEVPPNTWVAVDIDFTAAPEQVPSGGEITLVNEGASVHNVTIDEAGPAPIVEAQGGQEATATLELPPGDYRYYCNIPGHEALMNGNVTVS